MGKLWRRYLTDIWSNSLIASFRNSVDYNAMMNQYDDGDDDMNKGMFKNEQENQKQTKESGRWKHI